jgi:uncharacterized protein (DUF885 family)
MPVITRRLALAGLLLTGPMASLGTNAFAADSEDARFAAFLDAAFDERLALSPEGLTSLGIKQQYDRLDDYTDAGEDRVLALLAAQRDRMKTQFDPAKLSPASRISWKLFDQQIERELEGKRWRYHNYIATTQGSPAGQFPVFLINQHRVDDESDARAYIARLREVKRVMGEISANLKTSASKGVVAPTFTFEPIEKDARKVISGAPFDGGADSAIWADFQKKVGALTIADSAKAKLLDDGRIALNGDFKAGYEQFLATQGEMRALSKGANGVWSLPDGAAYYAYRLRASTTTDLTADQIHETGLSELKRIQTEMHAIMDKVAFKGSLQDFFTLLKTDARFQYPNTPEGKAAYLKDSTGFIDQAMAKAPEYFLRLPKAKLEVRAVEEWRQATAGIAFYNRPAPDGSRPAIYYVNLSDMTQVLKPQIEGISYHEGAPGHHFQIALAQETQGLPKFRKLGGYGAYIEGWGLYAERLGKEMGFYKDPYSDFGRLTTEAWRAVRLVTDTGLHAKKWTREQAMQYFRENCLLSERDIQKEVERYICWPGQATSYKVGELKIRELRARAEKAQGGKFDIRVFHDVILRDGALPLDVLDEQVSAWIAEA